MAFFPMTFPFYFDPTDAYVPFRPISPETIRAFGTIIEDSRTFLDPTLIHRLSEDSVGISDRTFGSVDELYNRSFGLIPCDKREFPSSSSYANKRVFGATPSSTRSFDDDTHEGRS